MWQPFAAAWTLYIPESPDWEQEIVAAGSHLDELGSCLADPGNSSDDLGGHLADQGSHLAEPGSCLADLGDSSVDLDSRLADQGSHFADQSMVLIGLGIHPAGPAGLAASPVEWWDRRTEPAGSAANCSEGLHIAAVAGIAVLPLGSLVQCFLGTLEKVRRFVVQKGVVAVETVAAVMLTPLDGTLKDIGALLATLKV